ncbi:DnaB-like helicase N-terminal domain-containing protein [Streptomyces orinoci]|uniref:DnaB-like helicase N-terminal domain-containing protein n=1 Tax=Streptomyces orinoci TaxID=67339 RepID=A0ABV3JUN4_STRON|nr:DnaB-like helicase N-terminal domain-containing protein [Streptomyces orinoci]
MPTTTPEPDEDLYPDDFPPPEPVHYAEQALLGALLLHPQRLKTIGPLEPDHFGNHSHGTLFAAMRTVPVPDPEAHAKEPVWLNAVLEAARPEAPGLDASYLFTLVQACPRPEHAATYAQMIRAGHARRTLRMHAQRLAHTAADTTLPNPAASTVEQADALARFLDELAGQFPPHPGSLPRTPLPPPPPRETHEDALDEERLLLATATAHSAELKTMRWLQATDFSWPLHGAVFQCLAALAHRGDPVDPVTVLWEAQHRALLTPGIAPADLMALLSTPAGSPEYWGEKILQRSLLAQARTTAERIQALTDDPANTPHQLVTGSRRALADFTAVRARWQHTGTKPSPAARLPSRAPAAPRAGPPRPAPPATPVRVTR